MLLLIHVSFNWPCWTSVFRVNSRCMQYLLFYANNLARSLIISKVSQTKLKKGQNISDVDSCNYLNAPGSHVLRDRKLIRFMSNNEIWLEHMEISACPFNQSFINYNMSSLSLRVFILIRFYLLLNYAISTNLWVLLYNHHEYCFWVWPYEH